MTLNELWTRLAQLDVKVWAEEDQLAIDAPKGVLTLELRNALLEHKAEILSFLRQNEVGSPSLPMVEPAVDSRYDPFPLTDMQQAYWVGRREGLELGKVAIHVYTEIECQALDIERLTQAWNKLVARHEMLRAVVLPTGQQQILAQVPTYKIEVINLRGLDSLTMNHQLEATRNRMSHDVFALEQWPLFEVIVSQLDERRARLHISIDGIFLDYRSFQLLFRELVHLYQEPDAYQERLELSFRDYVLTTLQLQESKSYQTSLDYWRSRLQTLPPAPELPLAKNPNALTQTVFERWQAQLDPDTWQRLQKQASKAGVTSSALLLAAYAEVLAVWSKTPRFTMNVPLFNRLALHPQVNQVLGTFSSFTLVEVDHSTEDPFLARARKIQEQLRSGLDHSHVSGVRILREMFQMQGGVAAGAMPIVFTSAPNIEGTVSLPTVFQELGEFVTFISQTPQVWIDNQVQYGKDGLFFNWDAVAELFPEGMLSDMFEAYQSLLKQLAFEEAWHSTALQLVPQAQLDQRAKMNATEAPISDELLQTLFTAQVSQRPDQVAVVSSTRTLTYQELFRRANQVGHRLRQLDVRPNQLVAVVMEKGWEQVVAVLGILLSGAAYLPIDPDLPKERLGYFLENGEVQVVLTQSWVDQSLLWPEQIQRIAVDQQAWASAGLTPLTSVQQAEDLACVIYTSGSTGLPKGVMITHRGVVNAITATNQHFNIGPKDRVLALTPLIHDMSMYDIFGILAAGGTIVMPDAARRRDPARWLELMESEQVSIWNSVPAMMEMLLDYTAPTGGRGRSLSLLPSPSIGGGAGGGGRFRGVPSLRVAFLGGDWIGLTIPERLKAIAEGAQVVSVGGPTETTLWNIWYPVQAVDPAWKSIPYGKPIANTRYYVLNEALSERPVWVPGQLYVAGVGVSPGYWRDEEKTKAKFITHPITGERLYATGDLGRYLPDTQGAGSGNLEFLGRVDFQLKIRGRRIEPGEIEAALNKHPAVHSAVVSAVGEQSSPAHKRLVAYIVPERSGHDAPAERGSAAEAADYSRLAGVVIQNQAERIEFKLQELGLRASEPNQSAGARSEFQLPKPEFDATSREAYLSRQSYRQFLTEPISLDSFGHLLSCLLQIKLDDAPLPKYRYPSGGGLYPVRTYVYIKPNRVEGMAGGFYYYHPASHRLILTEPYETLKGVYSGINQPIFAQSAFSLFLVGQMEAITPMYGELARDFCLLEAGYMGQLLMQEAPKKKIGLCAIGALEFDVFRDAFGLESSEILLHSFVGGKINPAQSKQWLQPTSQSAPVEEEQLRHYLSEKLPAYMVPSTYLFLEALPLTANGKVDRQALPALDVARSDTRKTHFDTRKARFDTRKVLQPPSPLEKEVAAIVQDMLGKTVGLHDNFFEQGGDSVMAVQFISRLRNEFSIEYPLRDFFDTPTVERVAKFIEIAQWATQEELDFGEIDDEEGEI